MEPSCYVARYRACGCAYAVIVEGKGREHEVTEMLVNVINDGDYVDHMTVDHFRKNVELVPAICPAGGKH